MRSQCVTTGGEAKKPKSSVGRFLGLFCALIKVLSNLRKGASLVIFSTKSRTLFSRFKNQDCYRMLGFANGIAEVASTYGIAEPDEKFWRFSLCNHLAKIIQNI